MKIHSAKSKKEDQKSHFTPKGIPSCLVVEWVFPSIYFQQWVTVSKWPRIQLEAEQLHSHRVLVINYTVASGRQQETPFLRKSRERVVETRRWRGRGGKQKSAATQRPLTSATAQPVTTQPETHCAFLYCLSLSPSLVSPWLAAGVA